ncbi:MFS transporter [Metallosphaera cuprina]|uniref:Major facilitator transporter n=1 Tax=Metallosphaera cuprina (strain Ar-4) TaxID=1006006 RepID=F4G014_METCR|nr:MFS transporter [Metallosphaera cuprina]AEB95776.1 major facilitator transporter [Metallosphaera cuprina Ar-4]
MSRPSFKTLSSSKRAIRLLPVLFYLYIVNFLDRVNISYAISAGMFRDLGVPKDSADLIASVASSLFFVAYAIPQVFSNLGINRLGVRRVFSIAFGAWGIITILTGFVQSVPEIYALRFALGLAESPFYAGVIFYLSVWFLKDERGFANSLFNAAIPVSGIIGGLIAGSFFSIYGDDPGWRYLFIFEGVLALISIAIIWFLLTDFPKEAKWLTQGEKEEFIHKMNVEMEEKRKLVRHASWTKALRDRDVLMLALVYFLGVTSLYGYTIWLPSIIKSFGVSASTASYLSVIPYVIASISLIFISRYSDVVGVRKLIALSIFLIAGIGLAISAATLSSPALSFLFFTIAAIGIYSFIPVFWTIPTEFLSEDSAAASIGLINALGNLGGIAGPIIVGYLESLTGVFTSGVYSLALFDVLAAIIVLTIRKSR